MSSRVLQCRALALLLVVSLLPGCPAIYPRQDLEPQAAATIRRVSILCVDEPRNWVVPLDVTPALGVFGLVGVAVVAAAAIKRSEERTRPCAGRLAPRQPSFPSVLVDELTRELNARGFDVAYRADWRPVAKGRGAPRCDFDYSQLPRVLAQSDEMIEDRGGTGQRRPGVDRPVVSPDLEG